MARKKKEEKKEVKKEKRITLGKRKSMECINCGYRGTMVGAVEGIMHQCPKCEIDKFVVVD